MHHIHLSQECKIAILFASQPFHIFFASKIFLFPECSDSLLWWCKGSTLQHESHIKCIPNFVAISPPSVTQMFCPKLSFQLVAFLSASLISKMKCSQILRMLLKIPKFGPRGPTVDKKKQNLAYIYCIIKE